MNKAIITGRLTKDVDLRTTQSGKSVASFTVAVDRMDEGADFIDCVAWGKTAENMQRYLSKGSKVLSSAGCQSGAMRTETVIKEH